MLVSKENIQACASVASARGTCAGVDPWEGRSCLYARRHSSLCVLIILLQVQRMLHVFQDASYLSSSILPGVFSHDKNYLHIIYIYRFAAFLCQRHFYRLRVSSSLLPSLLSSLPFLLFFSKNSNTITLSPLPIPFLHISTALWQRKSLCL